MDAQVPLSLPREQVTKLAAIGHDSATQVVPHASRTSELSWAVLAAFQVLLARYSRQEDVTVGTTKAAGDTEVRSPWPVVGAATLVVFLRLQHSPLAWARRNHFLRTLGGRHCWAAEYVLSFALEDVKPKEGT